MTMTDGTTKEDQGSPVVDASLLAQAFRQARAEERAEKDAQKAQKQGGKSRFEKEIKSLLERKDIEPENVKLIAGLIQAAREDASGEIESANQKNAVQNRDARFLAALDASINGYAKDDEGVQESAALIRQKVIDEYFNDPSHKVSVMSEFNRGNVDQKTIDGLTKKHVERLAKLWGKDVSAKGPAIKSGVSSATASIEAASGSVESFSEVQRDIYKAHKSQLMQQAGSVINGETLTPEIIEKKALAAASRMKR